MMIDFETAVTPFAYQVLSHIDYDNELLATVNGAYINLWRWDGEEWTNYECLGLGDQVTDSYAGGIASTEVGKLSRYLEDRIDQYLYPFQVTYASAGCLPEGEPEVFVDIDAARDHLREQWEDVAGGLDEWHDEDGIPSDAYADAVNAIEAITDYGAKVDDPTPDSLYSWTLEER